VITLRSTADPVYAIEHLRNAALAVANIIGQGGTAADRLHGWRRWVSTTQTIFTPVLTESAVRAVVRGDLHDLLQSVVPESYGDQLTWLVDSELIRRKDQLEAAANELETVHRRWTGRGRGPALVLDTNVLMDFGRNLVEVHWHRVADVFPTQPISLVVPIQVVEELDGQKDRGTEGARNLARATLRWIDELFSGGWQDAEVSVEGRGSQPRVTLRLLIDELDRVPLPRPDADIIDRALSLAPFVTRTVMVSHDRSMQLRARAAGLDAVPLRYADVPNGKQRIAKGGTRKDSPEDGS